MPPVRVCVISWATLLFLSRDAPQYSEAILALSWALLALVSAILPRSSKYVLVIVVVATLSTPPSVVVSSNSKHVPTTHPAQLNILGLFAWLCRLPKLPRLLRMHLLRRWVNSMVVCWHDALRFSDTVSRATGEGKGIHHLLQLRVAAHRRT